MKFFFQEKTGKTKHWDRNLFDKYQWNYWNTSWLRNGHWLDTCYVTDQKLLIQIFLSYFLQVLFRTCQNFVLKYFFVEIPFFSTWTSIISLIYYIFLFHSFGFLPNLFLQNSKGKDFASFSESFLLWQNVVEKILADFCPKKNLSEILQKVFCQTSKMIFFFF